MSFGHRNLNNKAVSEAQKHLFFGSGEGPCPSPAATGRLTDQNACVFSQEWPRQTKPKKGHQFMNLSGGHSGTKIQCESCLLSQGKTPEFTKMGEIHEHFFGPFLWLSSWMSFSQRFLAQSLCLSVLIPEFPSATTTTENLNLSEEDKRATTNVQNGLVFFFFLSFILFSSL